MNEVPEIYAESLYGRGLAFLDLGEYPKAIEDLTAAAERAALGGEGARRARGGAPARGGGKREPGGRTTPRRCSRRLGELLPRGAGGDAAAEKDATTLARGLAARGGAVAGARQSVGRREARRRRRAASLELRPLPPRRSSPSTADAAPTSRRSSRASAEVTRRRARALAARAPLPRRRLPAERAASRATRPTRFAALLREFPDAPRAREAAYYRFRALDVGARRRPVADAGVRGGARPPTSTRFGKSRGGGRGTLPARASCTASRGDCAHGAGASTAQVTGRAVRDARPPRRARVPRRRPRRRRPATRRRACRATPSRAFVQDTPPQGRDQALVARAALLGRAGRRGRDAARPRGASLDAARRLRDALSRRARRSIRARSSCRLGARVARGDLDGAGARPRRLLARQGDGRSPDATLLARLGRDLATQAERAAPDRSATRALALARRVYGALVAAERRPARPRSRSPTSSCAPATPPRRARLYEAVLAARPGLGGGAPRRRPRRRRRRRPRRRARLLARSRRGEPDRAARRGTRRASRR